MGKQEDELKALREKRDVYEQFLKAANMREDLLLERIADLESQLAELRQGGEAMIQELRDLQSRIHFDPLPRFNVPDEIDRIIDNFHADADFPQPAIPPGYAVVCLKLTADGSKAFYSTSGGAMQVWNAMVEAQSAAPSVPVAEKTTGDLT